LYIDNAPYSDAIFRQNGTAAETVNFSNLGDVTKDTPLKIKITAQPLISANT
jgi:hypothetical protein